MAIIKKTINRKTERVEDLGQIGSSSVFYKTEQEIKIFLFGALIYKCIIKQE